MIRKFNIMYEAYHIITFKFIIYNKYVHVNNNNNLHAILITAEGVDLREKEKEYKIINVRYLYLFS